MGLGAVVIGHPQHGVVSLANADQQTLGVSEYIMRDGAGGAVDDHIRGDLVTGFQLLGNT